MKKIIFMLFAIALIGVSCEQKVKPIATKSVKEKAVDAKKLSKLIEKELLRFRKGCNNIVVIDKSKIPADGLSQWMVINRNRRCTKALGIPKPNCYEAETCTGPFEVIDLQLVVDTVNPKDDDANNAARAQWLNDNGAYICYKATYDYFMDSHQITDTTLQEEMVKFPHYDITFTDLKTKIAKQTSSRYFYEDVYKKYARITVDKGVVDVKVITGFTEASSFSIPFLRSIEYNYCKDATVVVEVYPFVNDGAFITGFKVHTVPPGTNDVYFLNYSTDPK